MSRFGSIEASAGKKYDSGKLRYDLVPFQALDDVVQVLTFGAEKYGPNNWQQLDQAHDRYFAAALRHLSKHQQGEVVDPESGLSHLAHAACCVLFLLHGEEHS